MFVFLVCEIVVKTGTENHCALLPQNMIQDTDKISIIYSMVCTLFCADITWVKFKANEQNSEISNS